MLKSLFSFLFIFSLSFQYSFATDYYWVGGSGNWTDYNQHWAKTAGGNVFHAQVPGPLDNIYFDNNSLSGRTIINLDQTIESCKDISVTISKDSLIFNSNAANPKLSIYGSTLFSPRLKIASSIKLYFEASIGSQTYNQNRATVPCFLVFNNTGNWQITDSINVYSVEIIKGTFNAFSKKIRARYFIKSEDAATINITNSVFYTYSLIITKNIDLINGINIYTTSNGQYSNSSNITLEGNTIVIDSIFSIGNASVSLSGNAHIRYIKTNNTKSLQCANTGTIDRVDAINLSSISASNHERLSPSIGILNISNLKSIYISADAFDVSELNLTTNSDCNNLLQITGNSDNSLHKFNIHNNNALLINYCKIDNIDASAFPLKISNAVDGGNNSGITFLSYAGEGTLFRIGDGEWSDITKWSLTSNGQPANCQPTIYTNVIFDAFSFTKPTNNVSFDGGVCKDISVSEVPSDLTFNGTLSCYGDLNLASKITYTNTTIYLCAKNDTHSLKFTNDSDPNNALTINVIGNATYNLLSNIVCHEFTLENAKLYTNAFNLLNVSTKLKSGHLYGSTSSITTRNFLNELGNDSDLLSTRITCSENFNHRVFSTFKYGTIITTGMFQGSSVLCEIKHLIVNGSLRMDANSLSCDSLSIYKGILLNITNTNITFNVFDNPGDVIDCGRYTNLKLNNTSFKSQRDITFDHFLLENMDASVSSFSYTAINSINALNNTNVQFLQSPVEKTFYWINGPGNWSDGNHWSYGSGGIAAHCVPSRIDNVIFNENALQIGTTNTISIDGDFECKDFVLTNTPKVLFSENLNVFGSFSADSNAQFRSIYLLGNKVVTIDTKKSIFGDLIINKDNSAIFISDLISNSILVNSGSLRMVHANINTQIFTAVFKNTDSLVMQDAKLFCGTQLYLNCKNGLANCNSGILEIGAKMNSTSFNLISDSIPIHIRKIIMYYDKYEIQKPSFDFLSFNISNTIIDTLRLENSLEQLIEFQLYNTTINTLQAYNNNLRLVKAISFDMGAEIERNDAQPENKNIIKNAQLESYKIGIQNIAFDQLKIYPGSTLLIDSYDTLYINKTFDATGAPSYPIQIGSSINGNQGYIQNNGTVFGEYLFIQDNHVLNNNGYAGYYSSDVSNNMGWNFGVVYDTLLCTFNKMPCDKEDVELTVLSDDALTNTIWNGPNGFISTTTSPTLSNLSVNDNGVYTFSSSQGKCMVDISISKSIPNNIINNLDMNGTLVLENFFSTPIWYLNNSVLENDITPIIYPIASGYYKAATPSNRGCKYVSDSIYYQSAQDPSFQPILTSIESNSSNDIKITWTDVKNESGYVIYSTSPDNPNSNSSNFVNANVVDFTMLNVYPPGDYCLYVTAYLSYAFAESSPSNTLCINIPNINVGTIVQPQLTYIGLNASNNIEIRWDDVIGELDYTIFYQNPSNPTTYSIAGNAAQDATSFTIPNIGMGLYCIYIQANLTNPNEISVASPPLCINVLDPISTGIKNTTKAFAALYPNPTNGAITIAPDSKNTLYNIRIETLEGDNVFHKESQMGTTQQTLNLKQGVYIIKILGDSFSICEKLIVTQ